jgi:uncharacterized protein
LSSEPEAREGAVVPGRLGGRSFKWRPLLRALHRDAGYLAVGLTVVYALSGLAVNHIADWDPNFTQHRRELQLTLPLPADTDALAQRALEALRITTPASDIYRASDALVEVQVGKETLHIDTQTGKVVLEGQKPRFFLRAANWLHLNRGKQAWTIVADSYAVILLYLAVSGLFMIPGRKGVWGRGGLLVLLGALIPIGYVVTSAP